MFFMTLLSCFLKWNGFHIQHRIILPLSQRETISTELGNGCLCFNDLMRPPSTEVIWISVGLSACTQLFLFVQDYVHLVFSAVFSVWMHVLLSPWQMCVCKSAVLQPFWALPSLFIREWWWGVRPHLIKEKIPSPINLINPMPEKEKLKETCPCVCVCVFLQENNFS